MSISNHDTAKQATKQPDQPAAKPLARPSAEQLQQIAQQLACPSGAAGIEMAATMHASNLSMTLSAIDALNIKAADMVLELGHGNCAHLPEIMRRGDDVSYLGLEVSELMVKQAQLVNQQQFAEQLLTGQVVFAHYDGQQIDYPDHTFDKVLSVNCIYFWVNASGLLSEIARVLKEGGLLAIAYAQKAFMQNLPCVDASFQLFDNEDIHKLVDGHNCNYPKIPLQINEFIDLQDVTVSKSGETVDRLYTVVVIERM